VNAPRSGARADGRAAGLRGSPLSLVGSRGRPPSLLLCSVIAALALGGARAGAQDGPRRVVDQPTAWLMYFGDHALAGRWALHAEAQVRRADGLRTWQQLLVRPGLVYTLGPAARLAAGYALVETWPYGEQPAPARFTEHRLWQQLTLAQATGRVAWQHRYRLEQRWVHRPLGATGATDRVYSNRMRYLARATLPLVGRTLDAGEPYASVYDEVFVSWGRNVGRNVLDQNRAYAALGWRATASTRIEAGYLLQLVLKPDGVQMERNHSLQLGVFAGAPLRR